MALSAAVWTVADADCCDRTAVDYSLLFSVHLIFTPSYIFSRMGWYLVGSPNAIMPLSSPPGDRRTPLRRVPARIPAFAGYLALVPLPYAFGLNCSTTRC
jgi:hypothetical protein